MASFWESIKVDDNDMRPHVSVPEGTGPFPAVVVIQGQAGIDEFLQEITERLASAGYVGVAPELYHRDGPDCQDDGPTRRARLLDVNIIEDVNATIDFLRGHGSVDGERLGIVGFCMGGRVVYMMSGINPHLKAGAAYYAASVMVSWGDGPAPFDRTSEIHCPLIGLFGEDDTNPSPEDMRKLDAELTRHGKAHEFHSYAGAKHAFMTTGGNNYHAVAAQDSWPKTLAFFEKHMGKVAAASA